MKVTIVELINSDTKRVLGFAPVIMQKGFKPKMIIEDGEPLMFGTRKEARDFGLKYIEIIK